MEEEKGVKVSEMTSFMDGSSLRAILSNLGQRTANKLSVVTQYVPSRNNKYRNFRIHEMTA